MPSYIEVASRFGDGFFKEVGRQDIIWQADFTALPLSTSSNAAELRRYLAAAGLTLTRASSATVQTSASTVVTSGIGVDDPRVGNGGYGRGLLIEEARTNLFTVSRDPEGAPNAGINYTATANAFAGPDGSVTADRIQVTTPGGFGRYAGISVSNATKYAFSTWLRSPSGTSPYQGYVSTGVAAAYSGTADTTWRRISVTHTTGATSTNVVPTSGQVVAGANASPDQVIDLLQYEQGGFPTEIIVTSGATGTRAADILKISNLANVVRSGHLGMEFRFIPKGATADFAAVHIHRLDGSTTVLSYFLNTGTITIADGATNLTSSNTFTWNAGDVVDLYIEHRAGAPYAVARKNGGARTVFSFSGTLTGYTSSGALQLLGYSGSNMLSGWVQCARAYAPGRRPSWAA